MKIKFKIFKLAYTTEVTFGGYSDGYGVESLEHPVFKDAGYKSLFSDEWDTEEEAIIAIEEYGEEWCEYVICKTYRK